MLTAHSGPKYSFQYFRGTWNLSLGGGRIELGPRGIALVRAGRPASSDSCPLVLFRTLRPQAALRPAPSFLSGFSSFSFALSKRDVSST